VAHGLRPWHLAYHPTLAVVGCRLHVTYSMGGRGIRLVTFLWAALQF
jgi:hypothetical protein